MDRPSCSEERPSTDRQRQAEVQLSTDREESTGKMTGSRRVDWKDDRIDKNDLTRGLTRRAEEQLSMDRQSKLKS